MAIRFAVSYLIYFVQAQRLARFGFGQRLVFGQVELVVGSGRDLRARVAARLHVVQDELTLYPPLCRELRLLYAKCRWSGVCAEVRLLTGCTD